MIKQVASASVAVRRLITGPPLEGVLLGSFSRALIVGTHTGGGPRVLALLSPNAARVPNGVLLPEVSVFGQHPATEPVFIGGGRIRAGEVDAEVVRWWECRVPLIRPGPAARLALGSAVNGSVRGISSGPVDNLRRALGGDRNHLEIGAAVDGLVGLGQGLTPGGDDVIAGALCGLHASGRSELVKTIGGRVGVIRDRTTMLSADLLRLAAEGFACLELLAFLKAPEAKVEGCINRLLSIGHTSGADLAAGLVIGLEAS